MIDSIGATEAREKLADILDQVRFDRKPVAITRFGKTVAYVVPADLVEKAVKEYENIVTEAVAERLGDDL